MFGKKLCWVLILLVVALFLAKDSLFPSFPQPGTNTWQAVFLTNDQVYFGKLKDLTAKYVTLDKIFYLRVAAPLQQGATGQPALNLVKLGAELHGPADTMYIPKDKILFWENLRADSQVVQAIDGFLKQTAPASQ